MIAISQGQFFLQRATASLVQFEFSRTAQVQDWYVYESRKWQWHLSVNEMSGQRIQAY